MVKLIKKVSLPVQRISTSVVILALLLSSVTAFAQDTATAVNTDLTLPAFRAGEATEALGISEPTDGATLLLLGVAGAAGYYLLSSSSSSSSTTPIDANNGVLNEAVGATACAYDQFAGGGGSRRCTNTTSSTCSSETYGGNQRFYTHSRCSDLGL